jgi:hypothetical protein
VHAAVLRHGQARRKLQTIDGTLLVVDDDEEVSRWAD